MIQRRFPPAKHQRAENLSVNQEAIMEEAQHTVEVAREKEITLRIMGALGVFIHSPKYGRILKETGRFVTDIDLMGLSKQFTQIKALMSELGYESRRLGFGLSTSQHWKRGFYQSTKSGFNVDFFYDKLEMCHTIDLTERLSVDYPTIPIADIVLEKMQIVQINEKDLKDTMVLLREHDVGSTDKESVNAKYIAYQMARDWGFYYTVTTNLNKVKDSLNAYPILTSDDRNDISSKVNVLLEYIDKEPKSMGWKMRAKVGPRQKWYKDVEEIVR